MKSTLSLRGRLLLGAALWMIGLFILLSVLMTHIIYTYPGAPRLFHEMFRHGPMPAMLALLSLGFGAWYVGRGLSPLTQLRQRLADVHDGRVPRVGGRYPSEVQPLVDDVNALLAQREQMVARAQAKAGDLAHGLKTPLAVIGNEAARARDAGQADLAVAIAEQVDRMRRQIEYHLAQARAASGAAAPARARVLEAAQALARTLQQLYADRGIRIDLEIDDAHAVRMQRVDLDEVLGNLLDNACKWAAARVRLATHAEAGRIVIDVDDDGPGIDASKRALVLQRGVRADEAAPGSGLGLAIVRDLVELHGGAIALDAAPLGGARARVTLPAA